MRDPFTMPYGIGSRVLGLITIHCLILSPLRADVSVIPLFSDHMVLQQGKELPVWGQGAPGEAVRVSYKKQTVTTQTGPDGRWCVTLPPMAASIEAEDMVIQGNNQLKVKDVVVGDVWLCAGQSNMEFILRKADGAADVAAKADQPAIRHFRVAQTVSETPATTLSGEWKPADPQSVRDFTAVGYFFAKEIHEKTGVPIGLINVTWGGTPIEAWMDEALLRGDAAFKNVLTRRDEAIANFPTAKAAYDAALAQWTADSAAAKAAGRPFKDRKPSPPVGPGHHFMPWTAYNGTIHPLLPYAIRGILWYQGEGNWKYPGEYASLFKAMIPQWWKAWKQESLPFYFVQLPNFGGSGLLWPFLREAQARALDVPSTGMVVTIDVGDAHNQHPTHKAEVGHRLALLAEAHTYQMPVAAEGPRMDKVEFQNGSAVVRFKHAEGLCIQGGGNVMGFEIAGADRVFARADAMIEGATVRLRAPAVSAPVAVRYAWADSPLVNLYNAAGLPAEPFRTDNWARRPNEQSTVPINDSHADQAH